MKFRRLFAILASALLLSAASQSYAAYKYQDEKGNWVYSQYPPADGDFSTIKHNKTPRSDKLTSEERDKKITKARESVIGKPADKKAKNKAEKESAKNEAIRRKSCEQSKKTLSSLQVYRRFKDKDGNVSRMDENVRQKNISNAKANVSQFCD